MITQINRDELIIHINLFRKSKKKQMRFCPLTVLKAACSERAFFQLSVIGLLACCSQ